MLGRLFPPALCPLCGNTNACAMVQEEQTGMAQPPCWCMTATFTPELLARVPQQAQKMACVCQTCAASAQTAPEPAA